jgi:hypothetical protein
MAMTSGVAATSTSPSVSGPILLEATVIRADGEEVSPKKRAPAKSQRVRPRPQQSKKPAVKKVLDNPVQHFKNRFERARERAYGD